ncbi:hypothetical protein D3C84_997010 [compost metagenome]
MRFTYFQHAKIGRQAHRAENAHVIVQRKAIVSADFVDLLAAHHAEVFPGVAGNPHDMVAFTKIRVTAFDDPS